MELNKLILGLALNTRDAIDFMKVNKNFQLSRKLHGAKKNLIRFLYANYPVLECKRVLQFHPNPNPKKKVNSGHCMVRFVFDLAGTEVNFHLPIEEATFALDYNLTTKKVKVIQHLIPASQVSSYTNHDQIMDVVKLLNTMGNMKYQYTDYDKGETIGLENPRDRYLRKLETYLFEVSPLKLSL